jgi:3-carboxy-cis,cis-muconate cycloisomerase
MLNWSLYQSSFSTPFMRKLWSQEAMIEAWLKVEKTLANCQAEQGLIPESAAQSLAKVTINDIDEKALLDKMQLVGRPIVGLVAQLRALVPEEDARYVHYLSTTQDIMDTACMLQMQLSVIEVKAQLDSLITKLDQLALEHASTQMMGRTNGQHAVVIHLGTKLAVLVAELERRRDNLQYAASHGLMVQVGGPVGDLSQYPEGKGKLVKTAMAEHFNMCFAEPHWQNARDGIGDILGALGGLSASLCKIAQNVNLLASSDIAEVSEGYSKGRGASSSMAHKKNQRSSEFAEATARLARQRAEQIGELTLQQHERSGGAMIAEWLVIPDVFMLCSGALMWSEQLFNNLEVHSDQMEKTIKQHKASI